jgi:hypothetical protein
VSLARWARLRDACNTRIDPAMGPSATASKARATHAEQLRGFERESQGRVSALLVSLYQQKLTYGEFAQKRYEIGRDAAAAERKYRQAMSMIDQQQQFQAQQLAQQEFQSSLAAGSTFTQSVNARRPQTVRLQTNCTSSRLGNMINTDCR